MKMKLLGIFVLVMILSMVGVFSLSAGAIEYVAPVPIEAQASFDNLKTGGTMKLVYMPPATEFNYYICLLYTSPSPRDRS